MTTRPSFLEALGCVSVFCFALNASRAAEPPKYVPATAHYILPETTSEESGYFSLSESLDGMIHVGCAKYGHNSFLVEFDPRTGKQRVVLDTNKTCGLTASGYAAQAKLHTRNFVGASGKVYVGSKQGYPINGDKQSYPGGYVMNDPTLLRINLHTGTAESRGKMIEGKNPDSRCALSLHPDGKVYALIRTDNESGFGTGQFHHLVRYDPVANKHEDLGVLKVSNPDYYDWSPDKDGKPKHHSHGFHRLPDGTLTPLHHHMALIVAHDGTIYTTILYPFTLLRVDGYKTRTAPARRTP